MITKFSSLYAGQRTHPGGNGVASREIRVVMHPMGIVLQIAADGGQLCPLLAPELALRPHLPQPRDHRTHLTSQNPKHPIVDKV